MGLHVGNFLDILSLENHGSVPRFGAHGFAMCCVAVGLSSDALILVRYIQSLLRLLASLCADSCLLWLLRSVIPVDRVRFVRNHLRRGVRYDSGFRWTYSEETETKQVAEHRRPRFYT